MGKLSKSDYYQLCRQYHIRTEYVEEDNWPVSHKSTFSHIDQLGKTTWEEHTEALDFDSLNRKPWRSLTRNRAKKLSQVAKRCLEENVNEEGWRLRVESEILSRFSTEVVCNKCRGRLWRSEVEVTLNDQNQSLQSLEVRQKNRQPCTCNETDGIDERPEDGLNSLFSDRASETIVYDEKLRKELQKYHRPDRVYGLRMTRSFDKIIDFPAFDLFDSQNPVKLSPFRLEGDPLLFPFLIVEAKSEKGEGTFSGAQVQTAFPIREILNIQNSLRQANGAGTAWHEGPLCWCLLYKGDQWRIAAAYINQTPSGSEFQITDLWSGSIKSKKTALQLLLIIDYIFDWARDSYRDNILRELKIYAGADDGRSSVADTDIFSLRAAPRGVSTWIESIPKHVQMEVSVQKSPDDHKKYFRYEFERGVIQNAALIQSRIIALRITEENMHDVLQSMLKNRADRFEKNVQSALRRCSCRVTAQTLDVIELEWTGVVRPSDQYDPGEEFLMCFVINFYFSSSWEQVRELCYLAVSVRAIEAMLAKYRRKPRFSSLVQPLMETEFSKGLLNRVKKMSRRKTLKAAASRNRLALMYLHRNEYLPENYSKKIRLRGSDDDSWALVEDQIESTREIVGSLYKLLKTGRREPENSFLRLSIRTDEQGQRKPPIASRKKALDASNTLLMFGQAVLIYQPPNPAAFRPCSNISVWLLDDSVDWSNLEILVQAVRKINRHTLWFETEPRDLHTKSGGLSNLTLRLRPQPERSVELEQFLSKLEASNANDGSGLSQSQPREQNSVQTDDSRTLCVEETNESQTENGVKSMEKQAHMKETIDLTSSIDESESTSRAVPTSNRKRKISMSDSLESFNSGAKKRLQSGAIQYYDFDAANTDENGFADA